MTALAAKNPIDVIGDVHGQYDNLVALLEHMGYSVAGGDYRHPSRTAVFVGDLIDRGHKQMETAELVRTMEKKLCVTSFIGIDMAWKINGNHSGVAVMIGDENEVTLKGVSVNVDTMAGVVDFVRPHAAVDTVIAIDASLVVKNESGQRPCGSSGLEGGCSRCIRIRRWSGCSAWEKSFLIRRGPWLSGELGWTSCGVIWGILAMARGVW